MTYKILVNGEWMTSFEGTEKQVIKHVETMQKYHARDGQNRKFTYEATK